MPWFVPSTDISFTAGEVVTAAKLNKIRDDLADLDRRTSIVGAITSASETTTSTSYTDLATAGPAVTVVVGSVGRVLVQIYASLANNTAGNGSHMGFAMSGANTIAALDSYSIMYAPHANNLNIRLGASFYISGLAAGSTTFTAKYRATATTATIADRKISVTPLGS